MLLNRFYRLYLYAEVAQAKTIGAIGRAHVFVLSIWTNCEAVNLLAETMWSCKYTIGRFEAGMEF